MNTILRCSERFTKTLLRHHSCCIALCGSAILYSHFAAWSSNKANSQSSSTEYFHFHARRQRQKYVYFFKILKVGVHGHFCLVLGELVLGGKSAVLKSILDFILKQCENILLIYLLFIILTISYGISHCLN